MKSISVLRSVRSSRIATRLVRRVRHARNGVHDPEFWALLNLPHRSGLIADVGAHEGQAAVSLKVVCPAHISISFEANPFLIDELERTRRSYGVLGGVEFGAVTDESADVMLNIPLVSGRTDSQGSSLDADFIAARSSDFVKSYGHRPQRIVRVEVPGRTIDQFGFDIDLLKIDVEGLEAAVLRGAVDTIRRCRPWILVETRGGDGEALELVAELGYSVLYPDVNGSGRLYRSPGPDQTNALCQPVQQPATE
jgi:FkbM family methyltransferase